MQTLGKVQLFFSVLLYERPDSLYRLYQKLTHLRYREPKPSNEVRFDCTAAFARNDNCTLELNLPISELLRTEISMRESIERCSRNASSLRFRSRHECSQTTQMHIQVHSAEAAEGQDLRGFSIRRKIIEGIVFTQGNYVLRTFINLNNVHEKQYQKQM